MVNSYLRYSGLATQLFVAIGVSGWAGYLLDRYLLLGFPLFMLLFSVGAFAAMMFKLYRSLG